ncbi:putative BRCT domain-containing protein [Helianthus anomalus]
MIATAFDYTEEEETQIVNFDEETEELDITNFAGDLRALMVEDSDDVIALDSEDDEVISEPKDGKVRGSLWRRVIAVGAQSFEIKSSVGSNLTDKVTDNGPNSLQHTRYQETLTGISSEKNIISNKENVANVDQDQKTYSNNFENANEAVNESPEPGESTQADALKFVDHYLSVSVENSFPEVKIPKTNGIKSPFTSFAKGSHELAKKANRMNRIGISTFDWDGNQPDADERLFDQHVEEELPKCPPENNTFDVSFNTQMAAEVMESFLCAPPPAIDANENEDTNKKTLKQFSSPLRDVINLNENGDTRKQKELNAESSTGNLKVRGKSSKVVTKRKQNQDSEKENIRFVYKRRGSLGENQKVKTFSPVASRTRRGSTVKIPKRTRNLCDLEYITHERKTGDLDTISGNIKFEAWNWPKKKRTRRNMRQNAALSGARVSVVGPGGTDGNFREAFLMSSVKRKARSASRFRSTAGNKSWKGALMQKVGQPNLAEVTNTKCFSMGIKKISTSSDKNELTRLGFTESSPDSISKDLRKRRKIVDVRVLFSQNLKDDVVKQQRKIMKKLGISTAKDCSDATHFVADRFARTKKMLEAMAFGKPIVTPLWLDSCEQATCIIDENNYILRDAKKEKEIGFNMPVSLSSARSHPLLKDQRVFITSNVEPDREMIKKLVEAGQGQVMEGVQQASTEYKISDSLLILSCEKDYEECVPFLEKGAAVYSAELLLNGIIVQKLDYAR